MLIRLVTLVTAINLMGCATSRAPASSEGHDLKASLGKSFEEKIVGKNKELRYCPDNTCDVISTSQKLSAALANDFAWLFFLNSSEYYVLSEFKSKNKDFNRELLEKYKSFCSDKESTTKCILRGFARKHKLKVFYVRFDEGSEIKSPISL